jgi:hypothetical protein
MDSVPVHECRLTPQSKSPGGISILGFARLAFFSGFGVSSGIGSISFAQLFFVSPTVVSIHSEVVSIPEVLQTLVLPMPIQLRYTVAANSRSAGLNVSALRGSRAASPRPGGDRS